MTRAHHEIFSDAYDNRKLIRWQDNNGVWSQPGFIEAGLQDDGVRIAIRDENGNKIGDSYALWKNVKDAELMS